MPPVFARRLMGPAPVRAIPAWSWLAAILLVAAVLRLVFLSGFRGSDEVQYLRQAVLLSQGLFTLSDSIVQRRFGYSFPVAGLIALFGTSLPVLVVVPLLSSLAEIATVYWLGLKLIGARAGLVAAVVLAFTPLHIAAPGWLTPDAVLALTATLGFALLVRCRETGAPLTALWAGIIGGYGIWLKDKAALFVVAMAVMAVLVLRRQGLFLFVAAGMVAMVGLYGAFFYWLSGEPWFLITGLMENVKTRYGAETVSASTALWAYPRMFLLSPHHYGLIPLLAVIGAPAAWFGKARSPETRLLAFWAVGLLLLYSAMPGSLSPWRFAPKQENYALYFLGPMALLAALAVVRAGRWAVPLLLLLCLTGLAGGALQHHQNRIHTANFEAALDYWDAAPPGQVLVSNALSNALDIRGLLAGRPPPVPRWPSAERLTPAQLHTAQAATGSERILVDYQSAGRPFPILAQETVPICTLGRLPPQPPPPTPVTAAVKALEAVARIITPLAPLAEAVRARLLTVAPVVIYGFGRACSDDR